MKHLIVSSHRVWSTQSVARTCVNLENPDLAVVKHPTAFPLLDWIHRVLFVARTSVNGKLQYTTLYYYFPRLILSTYNLLSLVIRNLSHPPQCVFPFSGVYRGVKNDYCGQDKDCLSGFCRPIGKCGGNWKKVRQKWRRRRRRRRISMFIIIIIHTTRCINCSTTTTSVSMNNTILASWCIIRINIFVIINKRIIFTTKSHITSINSRYRVLPIAYIVIRMASSFCFLLSCVLYQC